MKTLFLACLLVATAATAQTPAFQAPLDSQVWTSDPLQWTCYTKTPFYANIDVQGQNTDGSYYGIGYFSSFYCVGRGSRGGFIIYSACADVVWDPTGLLVSVTPFAWGSGRPLGQKVPCTL